MEKSTYIILLFIVIMPKVSNGIPWTNEYIKSTTYIPSTTTLYPLIEHSELNNTDENIFQDTQNSFLMMKTTKIISKLILNVFDKVNQSSTSESLKIFTNEMNSVINKLKKIGINLYEESDNLNLEFILKIDENLKVLSRIINNIDYLFENYYLEYLNGHISNASLQIFISKAMSLDADSPEKSSYMIQKSIYSKKNGLSRSSLLENIVDEVNKKNSTFCLIHQTPQQFMYNLCNSVAIIELKAYIMILSAYKLHAVISNDDYKMDFERLQAKHFEKMNNYLTIFSDILHKSSTEIVACSTKPKDENFSGQILIINKLPKESDYHNNRVVTGVRFIIEKQVLHVQIEEGELIANGQILRGTEKWIPIDDMDYHSRTVNRSGQVTRIRQCVDYHSVTSSDYWYLNNIMYTKDVMAASNFVVIGANLEVDSSESTSNKVVYLRLKFAKINVTTAQLDISQELYSDGSNEVSSKLRGEDFLEGLEYVDYFGFKYDNIIPFESMIIDSQAVYGNPRVPLIGIGTFNKISTSTNVMLLKAFTFDFSSLISIN